MNKDFVNTEEFREWILGVLNTTEVNLEFTKTDGTKRVMLCTKDLSRIPQEFHPKGTGRKESTEAIPVFDLQLQQWRSFVAKNVLSVNFDIS
jgi:hypothetical protein